MADRIRVVFLIGGLGVGGSEKQLTLLLTHMNKEKFEFHVVVFNQDPFFTFDEELRNEGIQVWNVPADCRNPVQRFVFLVQLLSRLRLQIVHSWTVHDNVYAGLISRLLRIPVSIGSVRGSISSERFRCLPAIFRHFSVFGTSFLTSNSEASVEELVERKYPRERIFFIPNCVELTNGSLGSFSQGEELQKLGIEGKSFVVGTIGNLRRIKNHKMFLQGISNVLSRHKEVYGVIVGQPIYSELETSREIQAEINQSDLGSRIKLLGFRKDVLPLLGGFSVFCITSFHEGLPNALLEAMALERPVVATKVGGIPEVIQDGVNGILVDPGDVKGFSDAIEKILCDPEWASHLGRNGRKTVEKRYSPRGSASQLEALYSDLLNR